MNTHTHLGPCSFSSAQNCMRKLKQEQFDEVAQLRSCDHARRLFQDLPYDILLQCAEFMTVREVLTLSTLSRSLYEFLSPSNLALWAHFTQRVHLEHPRGIKQMLFNDSLLRVYAEVNSVPDPTRVISKQELFQWVMDRCEENILDLRMFADIIYDANSRLALTGLLMALQAVKKRMWYTEVTDVESVRDLLRATVVEEEHDPGWFVLRAIAGRGRTVQRRMPASMFARAHSSNVKAQCRGRQVSVKRLWKKASVVALEYLQLREVLRVVLAVSEVSDHPKAQQRYDSVLSVLCGTTAMLKAEEQLRRCQPCDMDEAGAVIPISAAGNELLRQIRDLNKVTVGGIVSYYFGYVNGRAQRKVFLTALFSMKHLAGAERYEGDSFCLVSRQNSYTFNMLLPAHQAEFRFRNHEKVFSLGGFNMNTPNVSPFVDIGARRCILQVERRAARVLSKPYLVTALKRKVSRRFQLLTPLHCFMTKVPVHTLRAPASSGSHSGRTIMVDTLVNGSLEVPIEFGTISSSNSGEGDASNVGAKQWFVDITSICSHASAFLMDSETGELLPPQKQQSQSDHTVERGPGANTSGTRRIVVLDTPRRQYRLVAVLLRGAAKRKPERPANFSKTKAVKRN